ncbi:hypothetical protein LZ31DRAFT_344444 [Colletotrichum somersetense]|nr:hypothetical protein LZ31DRAFT_344444 [Colletotrichum somersetense]
MWKKGVKGERWLRRRGRKRFGGFKSTDAGLRGATIKIASGTGKKATSVINGSASVLFCSLVCVTTKRLSRGVGKLRARPITYLLEWIVSLVDVEEEDRIEGGSERRGCGRSGFKRNTGDQSGGARGWMVGKKFSLTYSSLWPKAQADLTH